MEAAEKLAGKFLIAQIRTSEELKKADLDARMKKTGVKAIKAAVYMEGATKGERKPSDTLLEATVNLDKMVQEEQGRLDEAEVARDELEHYYNVFREAHIHFRSVAKGSFQ